MAVACGAALFACAVGVVGCGRTMSESDCEKIGSHLREVWDNDVKATAPTADDQPSAIGQAALKDRRARVGDDWMDQCRKELSGRRVDKREMDCVMAASTLAEVQACGARVTE